MSALSRMFGHSKPSKEIGWTVGVPAHRMVTYEKDGDHVDYHTACGLSKRVHIGFVRQTRDPGDDERTCPMCFYNFGRSEA
jgi:hypothetical protein